MSLIAASLGNPRRKKRLLIWTIAILAAANVGMVLALALLPLDVGAAARRPKASGAAASGPVRSQEPLTAYAAIYQRDLRAALVEPKAAPIVKPPPPKLTIALAGTAVDPGYTCAYFRLAGGQTQSVSAGQTIEGAEVIEIKEGTVVIRFADQLMTLTMDKADNSPLPSGAAKTEKPEAPAASQPAIHAADSREGRP